MGWNTPGPPGGGLSKTKSGVIVPSVPSNELVSKKTKDIIEIEKAKAKEEVRKEMEKEAEYEALKKEKEELQKSLEEKEKAASEKLLAMQQQIDSLITSKANINPEDPFKSKQSENTVDGWSNEQIENFEEKSAEAFFGDNYLRMK